MFIKFSPSVSEENGLRAGRFLTFNDRDHCHSQNFKRTIMMSKRGEESTSNDLDERLNFNRKKLVKVMKALQKQ